MRLIAFITEGAEVRQILEYIGVDAQTPRISPARGPPLWDDYPASQAVQSNEVYLPQEAIDDLRKLGAAADKR